MPTIKCEGQEFDLPVEIAGDDKMLIDTMVAYFPGIANAEIKRTGEGGAMVVEMVKVAKSLGWNSVEQALVNAKEHVNPAIKLQYDLIKRGVPGDSVTVKEMLLLRPEIDRAIKRGEEEASFVQESAKRLVKAAAVPARQVVKGF